MGEVRVIRLSTEESDEIVTYIREHYGINLEKKRVLVEYKLAGELEQRETTSFARYMELIRNDRIDIMAGEMVNRLTTNYTYFMREPAYFTALGQKILPGLFENRNYGVCNIWDAECSTGEEVYSVSMLVQELKEKGGCMPGIRVLATGISDEALRKVEQGVYPIKEMECLPESWQGKHCRVREENTFEVEGRLRYNVRFRRHNLMETAPGTGESDLVLCRNVVIYSDRRSREWLVRQLEACLNPGGYLLVGHAGLLSGEETRLEAIYPAVYKKPVK